MAYNLVHLMAFDGISSGTSCQCDIYIDLTYHAHSRYLRLELIVPSTKVLLDRRYVGAFGIARLRVRSTQREPQCGGRW